MSVLPFLYINWVVTFSTCIQNGCQVIPLPWQNSCAKWDFDQRGCVFHILFYLGIYIFFCYIRINWMSFVLFPPQLFLSLFCLWFHCLCHFYILVKYRDYSRLHAHCCQVFRHKQEENWGQVMIQKLWSLLPCCENTWHRSMTQEGSDIPAAPKSSECSWTMLKVFHLNLILVLKVNKAEKMSL